MKKRIRYKKNAYKFHKRVLAGKRNASKDIVEKIECKIRRRFGLYKRLMNEDRLEELTHLKLTVERMEALKDLYSYNSKAFRELKMELTTDKHNRISNLCPCCLLDIVGTLDHIIPKTPFPELILKTGKFPEWSLEELIKTEKFIEREQNHWIGLKIEEIELCQ